METSYKKMRSGDCESPAKVIWEIGTRLSWSVLKSFKSVRFSRTQKRLVTRVGFQLAVGFHFPSTTIASLAPGHGGITTPIASNGSSPRVLN